MKANWQRMTPLDQLMLLETNPNSPMCVTALFCLANNPDMQWLCENILPRLLRHPRFRSKVLKTPSGQFRFRELPEFTPDSPATASHIDIQSPLASTEVFADRYTEFLTRLSDLVSTQLPTDRPLWHLHVIPSFSLAQSSASHTDGESRADGEDNNCCTIVFRVHHTVSDGIGLLKFFASEVIDVAVAPSSLLVVPQRQNPKYSSNAFAAQVGKNGKGHALISPPPAHRNFTTVVSGACADMYRSSLKALIPDSDSVFTRSTIQPIKHCAFVPLHTFSVTQLKAASRRLGITINDMLFAALSAATAAYMEEQGDDVTRLRRVRCVIAMNRTMLDSYQMTDLSNQISLLPVPLHINALSPIERLQCCVETMRHLKRGFQSTISLGFLRFVQCLPYFIRRSLWKHLTRGFSIVYSNLPGPIKPVSIGNVPIDGMHFFGPSDGYAGVVLTVFSYNDQISIGVQADKGRISDPQRYMALLEHEVNSLIRLSETNLEEL